VRNLLEDLTSDPLHQGRHSLGLTRRAEIASLAAEGQQVFGKWEEIIEELDKTGTVPSG